MDVYKWGQYRGTTTVTLGIGEDDTPELDVNGYLKVNVAAGNTGGAGVTTVAISGGTINAIITGGTVNALVSTGDIEIGAVEIKNGTDDTRGVVSTAGADGVSNTQNELETSSRMSGFNGTTWDRARVGATTTTSTYTGYLDTISFGVYNAVTTTMVAGQGLPIQVDVNGNQRMTLGTTIAGEDITNDVQKVEQRFTYANMTAATTTTIKAGAGFLHLISINTPVASATVTLFDNTAGSGNKIGTITLGSVITGDQPDSVIYDVSFSTGLCVVASGATDLTISYR